MPLKRISFFLAVSFGIFCVFIIPSSSLASERSSQRDVGIDYDNLLALDKSTQKQLTNLENKLNKQKKQLEKLDMKISLQRKSK